MNALLDKAISALKRLPESEQEEIAREVLDRIAADARWDHLLADPRSEDILRQLASEVREEAARGEVLDDDPAGGRSR